MEDLNIHMRPATGSKANQCCVMCVVWPKNKTIIQTDLHLVEKITNPITATAFALGTAFASWTTAAQKIMEVISSILNFGKDFEY